MPTRLELPDLPALPDGAGLQKLLDDWLADHPEYQTYVEKVYYVPAGEEIPEAVTHTVAGVSMESGDKVILGVVVKPPYAGMVDAALAFLNNP